MNKNLVFFDIDGTLLPYGEDKIDKDVIKAINETKSDDTEVFICTGRCRMQAMDYIKQLETTSFICSNGQDVVYQGKQVYSNVFDANLKQKLIKIFEEHQVDWGYETIERIFIPQTSSAHTIKNWLKEYGILDVGISSTNYHEGVYQFWAFGEKSHVERIEQTLRTNKIKYLKWNESSLEILPCDESKAKGISYIKAALEAKGKNVKTYAFGDGVNDIEMLSYVDESVAMGNASDAVKKVAKHVTSPCHEDGIISGLKKVGLR